VMVEELAYGDCAIANQIGGVSFPYVAKLLQFGTVKQREEFLRPVVRAFSSYRCLWALGGHEKEPIFPTVFAVAGGK
jgi:hypothetical protein